MLDINECEKSPCDHLCTNTERSFQCDCREGYRLNDDGRSCRGKLLLITTLYIILLCTSLHTDVDECLEASLVSMELCQDDRNSQCLNSEGSFVCICVPGYEEINGTCSRKK